MTRDNILHNNFKNLKKTISFKNFRFYILLLLCFSLPLNEKASTILIIVSFVLSLFFFKNIKKIAFFKLLPLLLLYIIYIAAFYRDEYSFGISLFEQKISFIIFPLIFSTFNLEENKKVKILKTFVYGCLFVYLLALLIAFTKSIDFLNFKFNPIESTIRYKNFGFLEHVPLQTNNFLGSNFAFSMQTLYLAMYFIFSILIIIFYKKEFKKPFLLITFLSIGVFQLFSEMGLVCLFLLGVNTLYLKFNKKITFLVFLSFLVTFFYLEKDKLTYLKTSTEIESLEEKSRYLSRINERLVIWNVIPKVLLQNPIFGNGIKEAQNKLNNEYKKIGFYGNNAFEKRLNAHNQYLQILIETGIFGFGLLLLIMYNFFNYIKVAERDKKIAIAFILLISLNFMTESMFNRYIGISFIMFFYSLFYFTTPHNNKKV